MYVFRDILLVIVFIVNFIKILPPRVPNFFAYKCYNFRQLTRVSIELLSNNIVLWDVSCVFP